MFRKLVSNVSFSPALVGQLGFYARRLKKEEATRRLGLVFTALALVVQSFVVFSAPEPANAASSNDMIRGGVRSKEEFLRHYDANSNSIKDFFTDIGITRSEINATKPSKLNSKSGALSWGMKPQFSAAKGEKSYTVRSSQGGSTTFYSRPLALWDSTSYTKKNGSTYDVYVGHSAKFGWFAIIKNCGNLASHKHPEKKREVESPRAACRSLRQISRSSKTYTFEATSSVSGGATVKSYTYSVTKSGKKVASKTNSSKSLTDKFTYTVSDYGSYTVSVSVSTSTGTKTSASCQVSFNVNPPSKTPPPPTPPSTSPETPPTPPETPRPLAECSSLKLIKQDGDTKVFQTNSSTHGGATISAYKYTVTRDGKTVSAQSQNSNALSNNFTYTAQGSGTYKVSVIVATSEGDKSSPNCESTFTVTPPTMCPYNPSLPVNHPDCQPCAPNSNIWIKSDECEAELISNKKAINISRGGVDATTIVARSNDRITYTLTTTNRGIAPTKATFKEDLSDIVEYASVIDKGGAEYDSANHTLTWPEIELKPKEEATRMFTVQLASVIPAAAQGVSDKTSYDCTILNTFGNSVEINVECPVEKEVEQVVAELPHTGVTENMIFAGTLFAIVTYFYARSRQLKTEVKLVRRSVNAATV